MQTAAPGCAATADQFTETASEIQLDSVAA
jgi:hypothetical protein